MPLIICILRYLRSASHRGYEPCRLCKRKHLHTLQSPHLLTAINKSRGRCRRLQLHEFLQIGVQCRAICLRGFNLDRVRNQAFLHNQIHLQPAGVAVEIETRLQALVSLSLQQLCHYHIFKNITHQGMQPCLFRRPDTQQRRYQSRLGEINLRCFDQPLSVIFIVRMQGEDDIRCFQHETS